MRALMQLVEGDHSIVRTADLAKVAPEVLAAARRAGILPPVAAPLGWMGAGKDAREVLLCARPGAVVTLEALEEALVPLGGRLVRRAAIAPDARETGAPPVRPVIRLLGLAKRWTELRICAGADAQSGGQSFAHSRGTSQLPEPITFPSFTAHQNSHSMGL